MQVSSYIWLSLTLHHTFCTLLYFSYKFVWAENMVILPEGRHDFENRVTYSMEWNVRTHAAGACDTAIVMPPFSGLIWRAAQGPVGASFLACRPYMGGEIIPYPSALCRAAPRGVEGSPVPEGDDPVGQLPLPVPLLLCVGAR